MVAAAAAFVTVFVVVVMLVVVMVFMFVVMMVTAATAFAVFVVVIMMVVMVFMSVVMSAVTFMLMLMFVVMMVVMVFVIMMVAAAAAVWFIACVKSACQQSGNCCIRIAGNTGIYFNISIVQSNSCTHAHAAADQCGNTCFCQVACQCAVTETIGSDYFSGYNGTFFDGVYLELFGASEMLENLSVFISYCNFHSVIPPSVDIIMASIRPLLT